MKRFLCCSFFLIVMLFFASGIAEEIDFSSFSDEKLNNYRIAIEEEIAKRDGFLTNFYGSGVSYVVGKDIEAGTYIITCVTIAPNSGLTELWFLHWKTEEDYNDGLGSTDVDRFLDIGDFIRITLDDGNVFKMDNGLASFNKLG